MDPQQEQPENQQAAGKRKKRDWAWIPPDMGCAIILPLIIVLLFVAIALAPSVFDYARLFINAIGVTTMPQSIVPILVIMLAVMAALIVLPLLILRKKVSEVIAAKFKGRAILLKSLTVVYKGREALDADQPTGRGALVLAEDELWFLLPHPIHQLSIPTANISAVSLTETHRGKTRRAQLLRVEFWTADGSDAAAWRVAQPEAWKARLDEIITRNA